jgi:dimethylglycine dehydrogenase
MGHGRRALRGLATLGYTNSKVLENYSRRFRIRFPNEELPAARPMQTTPLYDRMRAQARSWGLVGLETPALVRAGLVSSRATDVSFHPLRTISAREAECRSSAEAVGSRRSQTSRNTRSLGRAPKAGCRT